MPHLLLSLAFWSDGSIAAVFNSPFIVPVFGTLMILGITVANVWAGVRRREMQSAERLAAIAKGIPIPPTPEETSARQPLHPGSIAPPGKHGPRTAGFVLTFLGVGLVLFGLALTWIVQDRDVLTVAAAGLIPLAMGIGFLVDQGLRRRTSFYPPAEYTPAEARMSDPASMPPTTNPGPLH